MHRFKTVAPLMVYLPPDEVTELKKCAKAHGKSVSQIVREGVRSRLAGAENPYVKGFDDGLNAAMEIALKTKGAQMMFPSGKSFGELVRDEIDKFKLDKQMPEATDERQPD
jgi:plasmid stability protein